MVEDAHSHSEFGVLHLHIAHLHPSVRQNLEAVHQVLHQAVAVVVAFGLVPLARQTLQYIAALYEIEHEVKSLSSAGRVQNHPPSPRQCASRRHAREAAAASEHL